MNLNKRKDILTNQRYERSELIRISILKNGETNIDKEYTMGGRGIYILPPNIDEAINRGVIKSQIKRFKGDYETILKQLEEVK